MTQGVPLHIVWRWYIYALHGYATEIIFTGMWQFIFHRDWTLMGNTSILIMPIYGVSGLVCEQLHLFCNRKGFPVIIRGCVYLIWTYFWEFSTGFFLKQFDMCPWDYSHYDGDFMGIVTLEYLPLWYMLGLIVDGIVVPFTLQLYWGPFIEKSSESKSVKAN